jgi:hypothetical protein
VAVVAAAALRESIECAAWAERAKSAHVLVAWLREARDEAARRERGVRPEPITASAWEHGQPIHDPAGNVVYVWDSLRGAVVGGAPTGSLVPPDKLTPIGRGPKDRG